MSFVNVITFFALQQESSEVLVGNHLLHQYLPIVIYSYVFKMSQSFVYQLTDELMIARGGVAGPYP